MLSDDDKKKLNDELEGKKNEVRELKVELNQLNSEKELWFKKKEDLRKSISSLITQVKSSKTERDKSTSDVKLSKQERDVLNKSIKDKTNELEKLEAERKHVQGKIGLKESPGRIKEEITWMQQKIETEVISFKKEKELMDLIKKKKKLLLELDAVSGVWDRVRKLSYEIREMKSKARQSHKAVQTSAKDSQEKHEKMITTSGEIDDLKSKEEEAFKKFVELKKDFTVKNDLLKQKLNEMTDLNKKLGRDSDETRGEKEKQNRISLQERRRQVEEKLKTKGKLTTEDLLIMQQS